MKFQHLKQCLLGAEYVLRNIPEGKGVKKENAARKAQNLRLRIGF